MVAPDCVHSLVPRHFKPRVENAFYNYMKILSLSRRQQPFSFYLAAPNLVISHGDEGCETKKSIICFCCAMDYSR